jgi:hypothetical protein
MRRLPLIAILSACLATASIAGPGEADKAGALEGTWTYRSFHNNPNPVGGDAERALGLIFAEAVFTFEKPGGDVLQGAIDWPGGGLDLKGTVKPDPTTGSVVVELVGSGRPNTSTDGWQYDYYAELAHAWPNGVDQVPALVGSVIRAKPHGAAAAGYTASFIAVKQP